MLEKDRLAKGLAEKLKQILQSSGVLRAKGREGISSQPVEPSTPKRSRKVMKVVLWKSLQTSAMAVLGSDGTRPRVEWLRGKCEV